MNDEEIRPTDVGGSAAPQCTITPPPRILVVEDEACMRGLNMKVLLEAGYQVDTAVDGAAAWDTLQAKSYDLLITDNAMPRVSGVELIEKMRAAGMALPVIMATGAFPKEEFIRQPQLQPAATLLKPYTLPEFLGTVKKILCATAAIVTLLLCLLPKLLVR